MTISVAAAELASAGSLCYRLPNDAFEAQPLGISSAADSTGGAVQNLV